MSRDVAPHLHVPEVGIGDEIEQLLIDLNRLSRLTTLGLRTLRRLDSTRDIPGRVVVGRRVLFQLDVIREWVRAGLPDKDRWAVLQKFTNKRAR
jgi:hypothetical protein